MPRFFLVASCVVLASFSAFAQFSTTRVPYAGRLELNGLPQNGLFDFRFEIYTAATGGSPVWSENQTVSVFSGAFSAVLGEFTTSPALDSLWQNPAYLQIAVRRNNDPTQTQYVPLTNRQRILTVPASARANFATDFYVTGRIGVGMTDNNADVAIAGRESATMTNGAVKITSSAQTLILDGDEIDSSATLNIQTNSQNATRFGGSVQIGTSSAACNTGNAGAIRFNPNSYAMEYCSSFGWGSFIGDNSTNMLCADIKARNPSAPDGMYSLIVNGEKFYAECDMTNGGWVLIQANVQSMNTVESRTVRRSVGTYLPAAVVREVANASSQVKLQQTTGVIQGTATSNSNNTTVINKLRSLVVLNSSGSLWSFTGGVSSSHFVFSGCETERYPAIYHACGNAAGIHVISDDGRWVTTHGFNLSQPSETVLVWVK